MAASYVGAATANNSTASTSCSIAMPTGVVQDDWMEAAIQLLTTSASPTTVPSGWTLDKSQACSGQTHTLFVYTKRAGASEAGPYVWQFANIVNSGGITAWRGVDTTTALDVTSGTLDNPSSNNIPLSQLTTVTDGAMMFGIGAQVTNTTTVTIPSGWNADYATTAIRHSGAHLLLASHGLEPATNFTQSSVRSNVSYSAALRPAGAAGVISPPVGSLALLGVGS